MVYRSKSTAFSALLLLLWSAINFPVTAKPTSASESMGVLSVPLTSGFPDAPSYRIFSPGVRGTPLFRGPLKDSIENNVTFYLTPDLANPGNQSGPFPEGVLGAVQAKAKATLDENSSVLSINLENSGSGYLGKPSVYLSFPKGNNQSAPAYRAAMALAEWNASQQNLSGIKVLEKGKGYSSPPLVVIQGGPHYLKIIDPESNYSGLYFPIISNSDDVLELNHSTSTIGNQNYASVDEFITPDLLIEVIPGWTLETLFQESLDSMELVADSNASRADWVYLIKDASEQIGDNSDYIPYFHDETAWRLVDSPQESLTEKVIQPQDSVIIARHTDLNTTLRIKGIAPEIPVSWDLPGTGDAQLVGNPFPTNLKLSDLIDNGMITDDNSSADENKSRWLANPQQELADNVQVLDSSGWITYWHDGTNLSVSEPAIISARAGSGLGGALTKSDFSMASGTISFISNPSNGNVVVTTSQNHGLSNGFWVNISSAFGRLTNENKEQINENGEVVEVGEGLQIESPVNGKWEITNVGSNTFELKDCTNNSDFIPPAKWSTGHIGAGYDQNVSISIIGGGGSGAKAEGKVVNGSLQSIHLIHGGLFYTSAPTVIVHPGGWNHLGRGNAPINDLIIPAGSGILLVRKHPYGIRSRIPLKSINSP